MSPDDSFHEVPQGNHHRRCAKGDGEKEQGGARMRRVTYMRIFSG
jgi:hypothetical protein